MQETNQNGAWSGAERRKFPRILVRWPAKCSWVGCRPFDAEVIDVSEAGFGMAGAEVSLEVGQSLLVEFGQIGTFVCRLAWVSGSKFGVKIEDTDVADYDELTSILSKIRKRSI